MSTKKSTLIIRILLFIGTAISLFYVPWPIVNAWIRPLPHTIQEQVDKASDYGFDGIVVCVNQKGKLAEFYTSGYKNREQQIPADPNSLFKIASIGKLYNALAIAKLVHLGKLSLDKSLAEYLPELKNRIENADRISLRMLVQHRSGIPNFTDTYMYWAHPKSNDDERLALILDQPANFEPDQDYEYCNTNYLLLRKIMNRVLGYDAAEFIQNQILIPLHLHHTFTSIQQVNIDDVMSGYYVGYDKDLKTDDNASMLATAEDLSNFIWALNNGSAFADRQEQEIYASLYRFEHTGLIPGYQSIAKYHKNLDAVVIQFTNTVNFEGYNWNLSEVMYHRIVKILEKSISETK